MISIKIDGVEKLRNLGREIEESFQQALNLKGAEKQIAQSISAQNTRQFATESAADGSRWKPLSDKYQIRKAKAKPGAGLLVFSGLLKEALENPEVSLDDSGRKILVRYTKPHSELIGIQAAQGRQAGGLSDATREEIQAIAFKKVSEGFAERLKRRRVR